MAQTRSRWYSIARECECCGRMFDASRYDARFCGSACRSRAARRDKQLAALEKNALDAIEKLLRVQGSDDAYQNTIDRLIRSLNANSLVS